MRPITLWPFPEKTLKKAAQHASAFVSAELSMGQMIYDVKMAIECKKPVYLANRTGGMVFTPAEVNPVIEKAAGGAKE